jgi:hypothetical protein
VPIVSYAFASLASSFLPIVALSSAAGAVANTGRPRPALLNRSKSSWRRRAGVGSFAETEKKGEGIKIIFNYKKSN